MGTALLSIGVRAMAASYASMQTTSHNIANAGVQGYSRQTVNLATAQGQFTGVGFLGRGVDVVGIERAHDAFVTREAAASSSLSAMDQVRHERLQQLEAVWKTGEQGIGHTISQFFAAMSDLASRPGDNATRSVVLARAQDLAQRFVEAGQQVAAVQTTVNHELQSSVQQVNGLTQAIATVNNQIAAARGTGQAPNDMLDQRDRLVAELSKHVQVTTIPAEDGTLGVFTGGGQRLVLGISAERLVLQPDTFDGARSGLAISEGAALRTLSRDAIGGGRIAGLLQFQDQDLLAAQTRLGQLARSITEAVNAQQTLGLNLQPPAGSVASKPLFGLIDSTRESVAPARTNARDGFGQLIGEVSIEVTDARQLRAAEYELRNHPSNASIWQLHRIPDDGSAPVDVVDGQEVDGFTIHFDTAPVPGDRYRLQPVTRNAIGVQRLLSDPLDLAAASPFIASTVNGNTGTVSIDGLRMVSTPLDATGRVNIDFTGPDPLDASRMLYSWTLEDSGGAVLGSGSGTWTPGKPIPTPPDPDINGFALSISGVPAIGDQIELSPTPYPTQNNGNALALTELAQQALVGVALDGNGVVTGGMSFNDTFIAALADVGVRTQGAASAAEISQSRAEHAEAARSGRSGVNLDEEAARLIQYQQSYQAAAKVLQIAQQTFNSLLDIAG